jgi:hypothetical protein
MGGVIFSAARRCMMQSSPIGLCDAQAPASRRCAWRANVYSRRLTLRPIIVA